MQELHPNTNIISSMSATLEELAESLQVLKTEVADKIIADIQTIQTEILNLSTDDYLEKKEIYQYLSQALYFVAYKLNKYLQINVDEHSNDLGDTACLLDVYENIPRLWEYSGKLCEALGSVKEVDQIKKNLFGTQITIIRFCSKWYVKERENRYLLAADNALNAILRANKVGEIKDRIDLLIHKKIFNQETLFLIEEICSRFFCIGQAYWEMREIGNLTAKARYTLFLENAKYFYQQLIKYNEYLTEADDSDYPGWEDGPAKERIIEINKNLGSKKRKRDEDHLEVDMSLPAKRDKKNPCYFWIRPGKDRRCVKIKSALKQQKEMSKNAIFFGKENKISSIEPIKKHEKTIALKALFLNSLFSLESRKQTLNYLTRRHGSLVAEICSADLKEYDLANEYDKNILKIKLGNYVKTTISDSFNCVDEVLSGNCVSKDQINSILVCYPELIASAVFEAVQGNYAHNISAEVISAVDQHLKSLNVGVFFSLFNHQKIFSPGLECDEVFEDSMDSETTSEPTNEWYLQGSQMASR